jgi:glycosyltransferase involved in cell wall biosynthesis
MYYMKLQGQRMHERQESVAGGVEISVIIPTRNRKDILLRSLKALAEQSLARDRYEVLVVSDGSTDGTETAVEAIQRQGRLRLRVFGQPHRGANAARNVALRHASGRLLIFINDDTVAVHDFLEQHLNTHERYPDDTVCVLGRMTIAPEIPKSIFSALHLDACYELFRGRSELDWTAFFTCNVSMKRAFLARHGSFDEDLRWFEDVELAERLRHHGLRLIYNEAALAYHFHLLTETDYFGMAKREGQALMTWYRKAPHLTRELAELGLPATVPLRKWLKFWVGDRLTHRLLFPKWLRLARWLSSRNADTASLLYRKLYQSVKRQTIYAELARPQF